MKNITNIFAQLKILWERITIVVKIGVTTGSFCGFIYLFTYTRSVGVPFPIELSVLPTILAFLGGISLTGILLAVCGILVPAYLADESISISHSYLLAKDCAPPLRYSPLIRIKRYVLISWVPMMIAFTALIMASGVVEFELQKWFSLALLIGALAWIIATSFKIEIFRDKKLQYILTTSAQIFSAVWSYFISIVTIYFSYRPIGKWDALPAFIGSIAVFSLLHMTITMPHLRCRASSPDAKDEIIPTTNIIAVLATSAAICSIFLMPFSATVGKVALSTFGIGGGIPVRLCLKDTPPAYIAKRFAFDTDNCSEVMSMLLDAGEKIYVTKVSLEAEIEKDNPQKQPELISFLQDDVLVKIYPAQDNKKPSRADKPLPASQKAHLEVKPKQ